MVTGIQNIGTFGPCFLGSADLSGVAQFSSLSSTGGGQDVTVGGTGSTGPMSPSSGVDGDVDIAGLTTRYVRGFLSTPKVEVKKRRFGRSDPNTARLVKFWDANLELGNDLGRAIYDHPDKTQEALEVAVRTSNSFDAGLAMGFFGIERECDVGSKEFKRGFDLGLILLLKMRPKWEKYLTRAGLVGIAGCTYLIQTQKVRIISEQMSEVLNKLFVPVTITAVASMLYGLATMYSTELFSNDAVPSDKLITNGAFRFHRNPYYASMSFGASLILGFMSFANIVSESPSPALVGIMWASFSAFLWKFHRTVKRDEKVLERQFGDEYRRYKVSTPRYFPAFWKVIDLIRGVR